MQHQKNKNKWPRGEWDNEPDYLEWVDEETGLLCKIIRRTDLGTLCGYVTVQLKKDVRLHYFKQAFDVHGTVIYANKDLHGYTLGFGCHHARDLIPELIMAPCVRALLGGKRYTTYKNIEYVKHECQKLAKQLKSYALLEQRYCS